MASARKATTGATSETKERTATAAGQGDRGVAFRVLITYKYNSDKGHHLGIQTKQ